MRTNDPAAISPAHGQAYGRVIAFDTLRGFTIVSMVLFHTAYDLAYLYGQPMTWFTHGPIQELWRISISWVFLVIAGWMTAYSRNNVRRAALYGLVGAGVWAATSIASVDTPISFGIIFCMAASTLIWELLSIAIPDQLERHPLLLTVILLVGFLALYQVPRQAYDISGLAWLGFPGPGFASGDYYPIIPFSLLYIASAVLARAWRHTGRTYPAWMMRDWAPPLTMLGRYSLPIYVAHQPLVLLVLRLVLG